MIIWTTKKGDVKTIGFGSVAKQDTELMLISMHLQDRADYKVKVARCVLKNQRVNETEEYECCGMTD